MRCQKQETAASIKGLDGNIFKHFEVLCSGVPEYS